MLIYSLHRLTLYFELYFPLHSVTDSDGVKYPHGMSSGDAPGTDHDKVEDVDSADLSRSHSSTIAGKVMKPFMLVNLITLSQLPHLLLIRS